LEGSNDGEIIGNHDVTVIERFTASCLQACEQSHVAISLGVVFVAGIQGTGAEGDSQDVIGGLV
jgi:hypothetical protein